MALIVNAFYGSIQNIENAGKEPDIVLDLHPFQYVHRGECPLWLKESIGPTITNGVTLPGNNKGRPRHIDGEQISRGINFFGLMKQLELLRTMAKDLECDIEVRISRCGKIGRFPLRFLVGLEDAKINFVNFPADWTKILKGLEPANRQTVNLLGTDYHAQVPAARIVSFGDEDAAEDERPDDVNGNVAEPVRKPARGKTAKTSKTPEPVAEEAIVEQEAPEPESTEFVEEAPPKPRKKTTKVVEEAPEAVAEEKPKRTTRKKAATPASTEKLAELGSKFGTTTRK